MKHKAFLEYRARLRSMEFSDTKENLDSWYDLASYFLMITCYVFNIITEDEYFKEKEKMKNLYNSIIENNYNQSFDYTDSMIEW